MTGLLLCGGTGDLGGRIAARLAERGISFRALVRPTSDTAALDALDAELSVGDLTDRPSLDRAVAGMTTVVTTANAVGRLLGGATDLSIDAVDRDGNIALLRAAEAAGVERFVFVSSAGLTDAMVRRAPFAAAKRAADDAVRASAMPSVVVRPAPLQDVWLAADSGLQLEKRRAVILGRGRSPVSYVASDDIAEACVRVALTDSPPALVFAGGPEILTRHEVVGAFERETGARFRRILVPRPVLAAGARAMHRRRPALASAMGAALTMDIEGAVIAPRDLRSLGIEPRPTTRRIAELVRDLAVRAG
ncbi:MAG TPA: NAD(P)H-binding protein [Blastococcus sp.]|nr:NAD(P)H-binding protein [Blastococcus sp.]